MYNEKATDKVKLYEICDIKSGGTPSREKREYWSNGEIPWVKIGDFNGKYIDEVEETITYEGLNNSSAKIIEKGSILFTIFATIGEVAILKFDATTNQAIAGITINDSRIEKEYLYYYLKSIKTNINNKGRGVAQNNINLSILKNLEVPIVSLKYQKNIVSILNRIDYIIELRIRQLNKINELTKSLFIEMFGDISDQDKVEVSRICKLITDGTHQPPKFEERGIPFLFVSNIVTNNITYDTEKFISEETYKEFIKRTPIEIGDLLLSTVGSYGHAAIVKFTKRFCFQRHIAYLKPKSKIVDSEYFRSAILSDNVQRQIHLGVKGIAQKTLNLSEIRKLRIPLPPMVQQQQFAKVVIEIDKSKLAVKKSLEELEILKKSLMQKYFA